jgi:hypothetical protein
VISGGRDNNASTPCNGNRRCSDNGACR